MNVLSLFDGKYEVTDEGDVFSNVGTRKKMVGKVTKGGYHMVVLNVNGKKLYPLVHRLIANAFVPNPDNLLEVNHIDGNKLNNSVTNLEWCNSSHNQIHARDMGLQKCKINMEMANELREMRKTMKLTHVQLGELFGIGKTQVGYILQNKAWCI